MQYRLDCTRAENCFTPGECVNYVTATGCGLGELNAVAPDTPVFILHLYGRALLNAAALRVVGYGKDTLLITGGVVLVGTCVFVQHPQMAEMHRQ